MPTKRKYVAVCCFLLAGMSGLFFLSELLVRKDAGATVFGLGSGVVHAQSDSALVTLSEAPTPNSFTLAFDYDGSNNQIYIGKAKSVQLVPYNWSINATLGKGTLTSVVVLTNVGTVNITGHGLAVGNRVIIGGGTAGGAGLNASYVIATVPGANSFTVATSGVADVTYNNTGLNVSTQAPSTTLPMWTIVKQTFTGTNCTLRQTSPPSSIWGNRTTTEYR